MDTLDRIRSTIFLDAGKRCKQQCNEEMRPCSTLQELLVGEYRKSHGSVTYEREEAEGLEAFAKEKLQ